MVFRLMDSRVPVEVALEVIPMEVSLETVAVESHEAPTPEQLLPLLVWLLPPCTRAVHLDRTVARNPRN